MSFILLLADSVYTNYPNRAHVMVLKHMYLRASIH